MITRKLSSYEIKDVQNIKFVRFLFKKIIIVNSSIGLWLSLAAKFSYFEQFGQIYIFVSLK